MFKQPWQQLWLGEGIVPAVVIVVGVNRKLRIATCGFYSLYNHRRMIDRHYVIFGAMEYP
jgi:hypothetical protein